MLGILVTLAVLLVCAPSGAATYKVVVVAESGPKESEEPKLRKISPAFASQFHRQLMEISVAKRANGPGEALKASDIYAAYSPKTKDVFFVAMVPEVDKNGQVEIGAGRLYWIADRSLLKDEKPLFGFEDDLAHFPLRNSPADFEDRPLHRPLDWGVFDDDFEDFQGDKILLSGGVIVMNDDDGLRVLKADSDDLERYAVEYKMLLDVMNQQTLQSSSMDLEKLSDLAENFGVRFHSDDACMRLLNRPPKRH